MCLLAIFTSNSFAFSITEEEVVSYAKSKDWPSALLRGLYVKEEQRKQPWYDAISQSINGLLDDYANDEPRVFNHFVSLQNVHKAYLSFFKDPKVEEKLKQTSLKMLQMCVKDYPTVVNNLSCGDFFVMRLADLPNDPEYLFKAASVVRTNTGDQASLPIFHKALKGRTNQQMCESDAVLKLMDWGMKLPPDNENMPQIKEIFFGYCYNDLKSHILTNLANSTGNLHDNTCKFMQDKADFNKRELCQ